MPCRSDYDDRDTIRDLNKGVADLREMLCEACNLIKDNDAEHLMGINLRAWWIKHQEEDRARQNAAEEKLNLTRIANDTLKTMTSEQIEALRAIHGLNLRKSK